VAAFAPRDPHSRHCRLNAVIILVSCGADLPPCSIRFRVNSDGRVEEKTVEGFAGLACGALTERIEASLGVAQPWCSSSEAFLLAT